MKLVQQLLCSIFAASLIAVVPTSMAAKAPSATQKVTAKSTTKKAAISAKATKATASKKSSKETAKNAKATKGTKVAAAKAEVQAQNKKGKKVIASRTRGRRVVATLTPLRAQGKTRLSPSSRKYALANQPSLKTRYYTVRRRGPSYAQLHGLRGSRDPLGLSASAVLAYDVNTNEVLYEKNADEPLPIASISKLMTALVIVESGVNLNERFPVSKDDFVASSARSKLRMDMTLSRRQALHLALMSSDNRAAHFLARTYPGGVPTFVRDMNTKAAMLGMTDTVFYDSIGLNNENKASAIDLSRLIASAAEYEIIKDLSTTAQAEFSLGRRSVVSRTTNALVADGTWDIELQKTGLTTAAGYCMVMQTNINGRPVAMIFLDAPNKYARKNDAEKLHNWLGRSSYLASLSDRNFSRR